MRLNTNNDVWVVISYGDVDIDNVYTDIDEAKKDCDIRNKEIKKLNHFYKKYEVKSLYDAIEWIKEKIEDEIDDGYLSHGDASY